MLIIYKLTLISEANSIPDTNTIKAKSKATARFK